MSENRRPVQPGGAAPGEPAAQRHPVQNSNSAVRPQQPQQRPAAQRRPVQNPNSAVRPQQPQQRPVAPQRRPVANGSGKLPYGFWKMAIGGLILVLIGFGVQCIWPNGWPLQTKNATGVDAITEIHTSGSIRLNELMSSNSSTIVDNKGASADWIEVANIGRSAVNLMGYSLAKTGNASSIFTFPNHVLQPGECVLVFADSTLHNAVGEQYHAPFRLSSQGGTLMLFNASGTAIDTVIFPALTSDTVYVRADRSIWQTNRMPTPGLLNTQENYELLHTIVANAGVEITELMASNTQYTPDENGLFQDYIELHNTTGVAVDLSGWFLSDATGNPARWRIPDGVTLEAGAYMIVYCSGLDRNTNPAKLHTNFGLSSEGEYAVLANSQGRIVDEVAYDLLKTNQAWVKQWDGTWAIGTPTPGAAN